MSVSLLLDPFSTFWDNTGAALAGTLEFYQAGTSTPLDTFTDSTGAVANSNPLSLTAGRATVYGTDGVGYKIVLKDSSGATLKTLDNVFTKEIDVISDSADNISGLLALDGTVNENVMVYGYHTAGDGGGGFYRWNSGSVTHNGITVISPNITFPATWVTGEEAGVITWYTPSSETGGWELIYQTDEFLDLKQAGCLIDADAGTVYDDTALQAAMNIHDYWTWSGNIRFKSEKSLSYATSFKGRNPQKGAFNTFISIFTFDPDTIAESTVDGAHALDATTITVSDASSFPSSGLAQIGYMNDCEYIKYTGKTATTLTGVTRGWFGSSASGVAAIVTPGTHTYEGVALAGGEPIKQVINAFSYQPTESNPGAWGGCFENTWLNHDDLVSGSPDTFGDGNALYLPYTAYDTVVKGATFRGFERALYCGRAYVTTLERPMIYLSEVACQIDIGNAAFVISPDTAQIGNDQGSARIGISFLFKDGAGATIVGGSLSNANQAEAVVADACKGVSVLGVYVEAAKRNNYYAKNGATMLVKGGYIKEGYYIGAAESGSILKIEDVAAKLITKPNGYIMRDYDGTCTLESTNIYDIDNSEYFADLKIVNGTPQPQPIVMSSVTAVSGVAKNIYTVAVTTDGTNNLSTAGAITFKYVVRNNFGSGSQTTEFGHVTFVYTKRQTLSMVVNTTKNYSSQSLVGGGTLTVVFSDSVSALGSTQTATISVTVTPDNAEDSTVELYPESYVGEPSAVVVTPL